MACPVEDQVGTSGKQPVWPDIARFVECSLCKVEFSNTDSVAIPDLLTRESHLTVLPLRPWASRVWQRMTSSPPGAASRTLRCSRSGPSARRDNKSQTPLHRRQVREGKRHNDNIALYKSLHASSSSGRSQSFRSTGSLARAVSGAAFRRRDLRNRIKSSTSPYVRGGSFLTCETKRTFKNYMSTEVVLCVFPDKDMLKALDSVRNLKVAVVIPWHMEEISEWIRAWNPIILGKEHGEAERLITNPVVEEAMAMLTRHINLSTGLINPSDRRSAIELLKILRDNGDLYDPASLRAWALRHGWTPEGAEDLESYAQAALQRRPVQGNKYAWRSGIIKILRQRASEKSEDDS